MNIKRIIREEIDDFGWIAEIKLALGQMWPERLKYDREFFERRDAQELFPFD